MLGYIKLESGTLLPRKEYAEMAAAKHGLSVQAVLTLMRHCETGEDLPEDTEANSYDCLEAICSDVERSGGEVDAEVAETARNGSQLAVEGRLTVLPPRDVPQSELAIVEAARGARLDNAYGPLREVFDFSPDMDAVAVKADAVPSATDWAMLTGMGFDMGKRSLWLMAEGIKHLMALGEENSVVQIASDFGMSHSHVYNLARAAQRVAGHKRQGVLPSVVMEIANASYVEDEKENLVIIDGLIDQARAEKWSCQEARSHVRAKKGQDEEITANPRQTMRQRVKELEAALSGLLGYMEYMAEGASEGFGTGEPEEQPAVIAARKALGQAKEGQE